MKTMISKFRAAIYLSVLSLVFAASPAYAVALKDEIVNWVTPPGFVLTPNFAWSSVADLARGLGGETKCTAIAPGCTGLGGVAAIAGDLSTEGITASGTAGAGNDIASTSLSASSNGTSIETFQLVQFNMVATDSQLLRFNVVGANVPEFITVDINYSLFISLEDRSNVASGAAYFPQTAVSVAVYESDTWMEDPQNPFSATIFSPFRDGQTLSGFSGTFNEMNIVDTLSVRPNEDYWVSLSSQSSLSLTPGPGSNIDPRDYAGLDVEINAWADPVFSLNADFAASNPDIADGFTITRISAVPLPAALPLLSAALMSLGFRAVRRRQL